MVPRTVVISAGGQVKFNVAPIHRVAIYEPETRIADILANLEDGDASFVDLVFPFGVPNFSVDDPEGRLAVSPPADLSQLSPVPLQWTTPAGLFDQPGRYLVICTTAPHLIDNDMFGWVIVK
ncbi:MAG TPA: hypothetical protein VMV46_08155 [Thermoanaerobaculia bacterium]|nr:hypothetical protein [Thermoanaerobaculia bacterium]